MAEAAVQDANLLIRSDAALPIQAPHDISVLSHSHTGSHMPTEKLPGAIWGSVSYSRMVLRAAGGSISNRWPSD